MVQPPKRISQHITDSKACAFIQSHLSDNWVLRDLTERDFGIDKIAERFDDGLATSEMLIFQIKGTENEIDSTTPKISLATKTLIYAEMFSVPFILLYCSVKQPKKCYYLWLQEYIRVRLNYDNPDWKKQKSNTVYFPKNNLLGIEKAEEHLTYIAKFPKYQESWVQYYLTLNDLCYMVPSGVAFDEMKREDVDEILKSTLPKLERAYENSGSIPKRFIYEDFKSTIELGHQMYLSSGMPSREQFCKYISNYYIIQESVQNIALRFDSEYLHDLYKIEGSADF